MKRYDGGWFRERSHSSVQQTQQRKRPAWAAASGGAVTNVLAYR